MLVKDGCSVNAHTVTSHQQEREPTTFHAFKEKLPESEEKVCGLKLTEGCMNEATFDLFFVRLDSSIILYDP